MRTGHNPMVNADRYAMVPRPDVPRSAFDVRWFHKTTFGASNIYPIYVDEVLPGDSHRVRMNALVRISTPIVPVMDNLAFESWFFFVPYRILWSHWERFMGEQDSPSDTTAFLTPYVPIVNADCAPGTLSDYFGITVNGSGNTINVSALPYRAWNLIWNDWFRPEDISAKLAENVGDGPDSIADYGTVALSKYHDYFTSALPWPQKPNYQVGKLPGTNEASGALTNFTAFAVPNQLSAQVYGGMGVGVPVTGLGITPGIAPTAGPVTVAVPGGRSQIFPQYYSSTGATTFAANATAAGNSPDIRVLVDDIRTAMMVQSMLEKDARGGTRYAEKIRAHFGVVPQDARLQRPELLGHGKSMVTVNPIAQTSASGATGTVTKMGQLAAAGYFAAHGHGFSSSFTEHGVVIGIVGVRSDLTYQQGVERMWWRRSQYDFYWPALAHLGEQAIMSKELYCDGGGNDDTVFGYAPRWDEYRFKPSRTSGYFRSTVSTPIDMWHFGEKFGSRPSLNSAFITDATPMSRVLQVTAPYSAQLMGDFMFDVRYVRPMPMFSVPGVGGRL